MSKRVVVVSGRMPMYGGIPIERPGQVLELQHLRNDEKLIAYGYMREIDKDEEVYTCTPCGLLFMGSAISGPAQAHLAYARHDEDAIDLDSNTKPTGRAGARNRASAAVAAEQAERTNPDSDGGAAWPLEPEGAPQPPKLEDEAPSGRRVRIGGR